MDNQEIIAQIGLYLDNKEIYELLTISKAFKQTWCDSQHFWKLKWFYSVNFDETPKNNDWKLLYFTYVPKKPATPLVLFLADNHARIVRENPKNSPSENAIIGASEWRITDQRQKYIDVSRKYKEKYDKYMEKKENTKNISKPEYIAFASIRMKELQLLYPDRSQFDIILMIKNEWNKMKHKQKKPYKHMVDILSKI